MTGRPCPRCGMWFEGTATGPVLCIACVMIIRFLREVTPGA